MKKIFITILLLVMVLLTSCSVVSIKDIPTTKNGTFVGTVEAIEHVTVGPTYSQNFTNIQMSTSNGRVVIGANNIWILAVGAKYEIIVKNNEIESIRLYLIK
jgi:hypothetical protein